MYKAIDLKHKEYNNAGWVDSTTTEESDRDSIPPSQASRGKVYVALKRIYVTSSPIRIFNELSILNELRSVGPISIRPSETDAFEQWSFKRRLPYLCYSSRRSSHRRHALQSSPRFPSESNSPSLDSPLTSPPVILPPRNDATPPFLLLLTLQSSRRNALESNYSP